MDPGEGLTFRDFVLEQLEGMQELRWRPMFGGVGLYLGDVFFGIVARGTLYLKVCERTRARYEEAGMGPFRPGPRQTLRTYHEVPVEVLEDPDELCAWAADAVEAQRLEKGAGRARNGD